MKRIKDFEVRGKRVLVRCDFNVPSDDEGNILNDFKIRETLPTIQYLIAQGAKIILMSHWDPRKTGVAASVFTMQKIAARLSDLLNIPVATTDD